MVEVLHAPHPELGGLLLGLGEHLCNKTIQISALPRPKAAQGSNQQPSFAPCHTSRSTTTVHNHFLMRINTTPRRMTEYVACRFRFSHNYANQNVLDHEHRKYTPLDPCRPLDSCAPLLMHPFAAAKHGPALTRRQHALGPVHITTRHH